MYIPSARTKLDSADCSGRDPAASDEMKVCLTASMSSILSVFKACLFGLLWNNNSVVAQLPPRVRQILAGACQAQVDLVLIEVKLARHLSTWQRNSMAAVLEDSPGHVQCPGFERRSIYEQLTAKGQLEFQEKLNFS